MTDEQMIRHIDITRIKNHQRLLMTDSIIDEDILILRINGTRTFQMVFSMSHPQVLAAGFLFTQGIVTHKTDITAINFTKETKQCDITLNNKASQRLSAFEKNSQVKGSSGGTLLQETGIEWPVLKDTAFTITADQVLTLIRLHWDASIVFHQTGAVHSAGLCTPERIVSYFEDIGRHNALDKLAGHVLLNRIETKNSVATLSCRMSLEIIGKIIKTGIPVVISNAAPTLSAVKLADKAGLTIIGFARGDRFNIYTHANRIK